MVSPVYLIIVPLAAAFLTVLVHRALVARVVAVVATVALVAAVGGWLLSGMRETVAVVMSAIPAPLGIELAMDPTSLVLAAIVAASMFLVTLYSQAYIASHHDEVKYYAVLMLLSAAAFGLVLTRDLFNLFVFYEILCVASYILVSYEQDDAALEASVKYLILGSTGSIFLLISIGLVYREAGSLAMADVAAAMATADPAYVTLTASLFVFGMGIEAAIFPVNVWLPDAHSSAPSSISALLSGFVIELALLVLFRVATSVFGPANLMPILQGVALAGVVVGEFAAFGQSELKRMLAYSSIGQVGIMLFALSLGTADSQSAALAHVVMHAGAKSVLFLVAGYFIVRTGSRATEAYRGLGRKMPVSAALFAIAALSLIGVPPLFGFFTKFRILTAAAAVATPMAWTGIGVILLGTVIESVYLYRVVQTLFAKPEAALEAGEMEAVAVVAVVAFAVVVIAGATVASSIPGVVPLF